MTAFHAVVLGVLQGLTEFLPISSTAHLTLAGKGFGLVDETHSEGWTSFLAIVQLGTLGSVIAYFTRDLVAMIAAVGNHFRNFRFSRSLSDSVGETKLLWFMVIGTIPIGLVGLTLSDVLHGLFTKSLVVIAASLIILAVLLWIAEKKARHVREFKDLTVFDAVIIGTAQVLALIPGSSRSGTTITAGLFLSLDRYTAARFSFLLSIPAVLASGLHEIWSLTVDPFQYGADNLVIATVVSGISGYAAISWLLKYLMSKTTLVFVWYRLSLGTLLLAALAAGIIAP